MTRVTIEFPLEPEAAILDGRTLSVDLGNGVRLRTPLPLWITAVSSCVLKVEFDAEGSPDRGKPDPTPVE